MKLPIALQLYSIRKEMPDFEAVLKKLADMGYDGVEFAGLPLEPEKVRALCAKYGLNPISAHIPLDELADLGSPDPLAKAPATFEKYVAIGCEYAVVPYLPSPYQPPNGSFSEVIEPIAGLCEIAKACGLTLLYHNHDFEFNRIDGQYALDLLYEKVPALSTEIDTCWVNVGGEDPAEYIRKYTGRAPVVHLKDFVMPGKKPAKLYDLIGIKDERETDSEKFGFRPLGDGVQDFKAILAAAHDAGAKWLVIEQDSPSMGLSAFECAQRSINYLKSIL
jgi:sugar phosphate isomerase/epimerase